MMDGKCIQLLYVLGVEVMGVGGGGILVLRVYRCIGLGTVCVEIVHVRLSLLNAVLCDSKKLAF